ncbi:hypothetical protein PISMIDRAFT_579924 [Pisolithus microcarpus 441]|uniref:Ribosomal protein S16 n=1 Tax=Pisolithus microcarpus 441 TaxID=765257 RepID=A0A0C9YTU7_9AGAM|nr:hypothetical protein PISMIDRAFT_579924 [Pisolithus microcarpus 441]
MSGPNKVTHADAFHFVGVPPQNQSTTMTVRLRMAVHGAKNNRIFHLVAIDHRRRRDAKPIELLGIFEPSPKLDKVGERSCKTMRWSVDRIKYWLGVGAVPSKPVTRFLEWGGITLSDPGSHPKPPRQQHMEIHPPRMNASQPST